MKKIMLSHELCDEGMSYLKSHENIKVICHNTADIDTVMDEFREAEGYLLRMGKLDRRCIMATERLKVIARPGVGVDTIDVQTATEYGIPVVITPGANSLSVAEHTLTMLLALAKNLLESDKETKSGNFNIRNKSASIEIQGKVLGILGFGAIGREVARLATGVGLKVIVFDPYVEEKVIREKGYLSAKTLQDLLPECDFVTLHVPSTPENRYLINDSTMNLFKEKAYLINCARGDLVDESALYKGLREGRLAGAAADLMAMEPFDITSPLMSLPNFIATPHMAALSRESSIRAAKMAVDGMIAVINGKKWPHICNPDVYNHPKWKGR